MHEITELSFKKVTIAYKLLINSLLNARNLFLKKNNL